MPNDPSRMHWLAPAGLTAALAALSAAIAAAALIATAVRHRSVPGDHPHHHAPAVIGVRAAWHQALLEHGMLPFLHQQLHLPALAPDADARPSLPRPAPRDPFPERRTRLGYTSPDSASPDFTGPGQGSPN